jgi:hypothetical protein
VSFDLIFQFCFSFPFAFQFFFSPYEACSLFLVPFPHVSLVVFLYTYDFFVRMIPSPPFLFCIFMILLQNLTRIAFFAFFFLASEMPPPYILFYIHPCWLEQKLIFVLVRVALDCGCVACCVND